MMGILYLLKKNQRGCYIEEVHLGEWLNTTGIQVLDDLSVIGNNNI